MFANATSVWTNISMYFIDGLPRSNRYSYILVVIDYLRKFSYFFSLTHPFTAKQVIEQFVERVATIHSMSESIITDHDSVFLRGF